MANRSISQVSYRPPSTIDPKDPNFPNALSDWSASTLGKLNALPKLTQGQLSAIAEAAVGAAAQQSQLPLPLSIGQGSQQHNVNGNHANYNGQMVTTGGAGGSGGLVPGVSEMIKSSANGLPIDLPASLAALFEAKLTLDREKAKLLRMQKELKAHREQMHGVNSGSSGTGAAAGAGSGAGASAKGKEVALVGDVDEDEDDDDLMDCPCGGA